MEFLKTSGEVAWQGLEQLLDLTGNEWPALYPGLHPAMLPCWTALRDKPFYVEMCATRVTRGVPGSLLEMVKAVGNIDLSIRGKWRILACLLDASGKYLPLLKASGEY